MAQAPNEVCYDLCYYSYEASSMDDDNMQNKYNKMCETSLEIIRKNKSMKAIKKRLENEIVELKEKIKTLEINKAIECESCLALQLENIKLKESQDKLKKDASKFV